MNTDVPIFDPTQFTQEPYSLRIEKPWGHEIHWVPADAPYMGKVLHINEGALSPSTYNQHLVYSRIGIIC